jgi:hypothetical protein
LNILEEQISVDLQMEYFQFSNKVREENAHKEPLEIPDGNLLFDPGISIEDKKRILVLLAAEDEVEIFRLLENYSLNPDPELREWAVLALQESRMLIESSLLDENQVFISTGLGGKNNMLRYFIVLINKQGIPFNPLQQKIITSEFEYHFKQYNAELEEIAFPGYFTTLLSLIPIEAPIRDLFLNTIEECNQYGDFLRRNFIVTNVKQLTLDEINDFLDKNDSSDEDEDAGEEN